MSLQQFATDQTSEIALDGFGQSKRVLSFQRVLMATLCAVVLLRLLLVFWLPFSDPTEARYAEIARKMVETNNWITPQFDYGVPFWGKPPLHTWLSAAGMKLFGVGEFGARILIFGSSLGILAILFAFMARETDRTTALAATLICATSIMFFGASAFVMTDMPMVLGTTLSMVGFLFATVKQPGDQVWGHLFFVGLSIGMLAKGPTAVVLTGLPIVFWLAIGNRGRVLRHLPWRTGLLLGICLTLPWYIAAEIQTPGFLRYFIVGEHIERFLVSGWQGDLYGSGHSQPKGTIWLFALSVFLPWTGFAVAQVFRPKQLLVDLSQFHPATNMYLLLWTVGPMLLFTPAANILPAYVLPAVPAFSCLVAMLIVPRIKAGSRLMGYGFAGAVSVALLFFASLALLSRASPETLGVTVTNPLIQEARRIAPRATISLYPKRIHSAEFYTGGKSSFLTTPDQLAILALSPKQDVVLVKNSSLEEAKSILGKNFTQHSANDQYTILLEAWR